jgi:peptidoglycan LD-endopeptidase LytH
MKGRPAGLKWNYSLTATVINKFIIISALLLIAGCGEIENLLTSQTPYEKYLGRLTDSGIINTEAGKQWKEEGERVFKDTLLITLPYKEILYFSPSRIYASGYSFAGKRGENINVNVARDSAVTAEVFIDLFFIEDDQYKPQASAESDQLNLEYTVKETGMYFLRIQPELLAGGKYMLDIRNSPSIAFPVDGKDSRSVKSFWGDRRDGGARDHKGVDIFADRGTPVLAASDGVVTRTGTNNLGGKVVWLTSLNKSYYYAHLDSQAVSPPKPVKTGDTLGFVGNTGNARNTPPHLHFGIYYHGEGAVDPLPYIRDYFASVNEPKADDKYLGSYARTTSPAAVFYSLDKKKKLNLPANTPLVINGSTDQMYKAELHNGKSVYINHRSVSFNFPGSTAQKSGKEIFYQPDSSSIITGIIDQGSGYLRIGRADNYTLVAHNGIYGWIKE